MSELWHRGRWLLAGALIAAGGAFLIATLGGGRSEAAHPLDVAPSGARLVARIDVNAILESHLFTAILEEDDEGARRIERTCGYDPLAQVEDAVVFVLGPDERPFEHVGFVARGEVARGRENRERLVACVQRVIREQGGAIEQTEIEGEPAVASAHGGSHAAFLGEDGVVGGDQAVVARTLRVASGRSSPARSDPGLERLWDRVAPGRDATVVGRLPERWLPALRRLAADAPGELDALASVRAFGLGVTLRRGLSLGANVETGSVADAAALEREIATRIDAELSDPMARFSVIGAALRRLRVEAQRADVVIALELTNDQIDEILGLWRELRRRAAEQEEAPPDAGAAPEAPEDAGVPSAPDASP